jgi:hypothetical protein
MLLVPLYGGLGNQLFGLTFALYCQTLGLTDVTTLLMRRGMGNENHNQNVMTAFQHDFYVKWRREKLIESLARKFQIVTGRKFQSKFPLLTLSISNSPSEALELHARGEHVFVSSSFQTGEYLTTLQEVNVMRHFSPIHPSLLFCEFLQIVDNEQIHAIHVRRGDYLHPKIAEAMPVGYYLAALDKLGLEPNENIFVFSDAPEFVKREFKEVGIKNLTFIPNDSPTLGGLSPAESLTLASKARSLTMSKSTFSWWAAKIGEKNKKVAYPASWQSPLIESSWIAI